MSSRVGYFKTYVLKITIAVAMTLCSYAPVNAMLLNFDQVSSGEGTLSYDGDGGSLVGTDILFETVMGTDTPDNDGVVLDISDGYLNFETGPNISEGPSIWEFESGGNFILEGTVKDENGDVIASGELLNGSWTANPYNPQVTGNQFVLILSGFGIDSKNQDLLDFYGITATNFQFVNTEISSEINMFDDKTGAFAANVTNADLVNASIPDASIMFLLGPSLLCLGLLGRRKSKTKGSNEE